MIRLCPEEFCKFEISIREFVLNMEFDTLKNTQNFTKISILRLKIARTSNAWIQAIFDVLFFMIVTRHFRRQYPNEKIDIQITTPNIFTQKTN